MLRRMVPQDLLFPISSKLIKVALTFCIAIIAALVPSGATFASEETDRDALVALYQATGGDNWYRNENWLTDEPLDTWYGVTTDNGGRVIFIYLVENGLRGTIPPSLGGLKELEWLNLSDNRLTGSIPTELGNLFNLESLYLGSNLLSGTIPSELGGLANLKQLILSDNQLTGPIPAELGKLISLEGLSLWGNELSGSIPGKLTNLTNLEYVNLGLGNQFSGCIPRSWQSIERNDLEELGLPFCVAPMPILSVSEREVLVALYHATDGTNWLRSDNWLTDAPVSTWYGVTTDDGGRILDLSLPKNGLRGTIPSELGSLTYLVWMDLSENSLRGMIPSELGNLTSLVDLYLFSNQLYGEIPPELGKLTNLKALALSNNQLIGTIPSELGKLTNLELLGLSLNQLNGVIPTELGKLVYLEGLFLYGNELKGVIPSELGNLARLEGLYLSGNQLSGCLPETWRSVEDNDLEDLALSFCVASATTDSANTVPLTSVQIFEKVSPAIAFVETPTSTGSGVLVDGGYLVTNAHVVWPFNEARVVIPGRIRVRPGAGGRLGQLG